MRTPPRRQSRLVTASLLGAFSLAVTACGDDTPAAQPSPPAGTGICASADAPAHALLGAPLLFSPTSHGFGVSAVLGAGDPESLRLAVRVGGSTDWGELAAPSVRSTDVAEWSVDGLTPSTGYDYEIVGCSAGSATPLYAAHAVTQRPAGQPFSFALITDTHIGSDLSFSNQGDPATLSTVDAALATASPDFVVNLGDMLDYHEYGFNAPPPSAAVARLAYLNYRRTLGDVTASVAHYPVLGGWDGENGCNSAEEIDRSRPVRLLYLPSPGPETYPEGGSPFRDYYAFTWGDALFVVLNVYTYTPTCHLLNDNPGLPDDWTLGQEQLDWLRRTLTNATSKWKFLLIHHPVGGNAGDAANSAYGRGGGRAAHVGEQDTVHQMMMELGVQIFFYGHDHVFTDMVVDTIHYSLPGSAGAIWMFDESETGYTTSWPDSGWGRVDVSSDEVHVQFIGLGGQSIFEYTVR